MTKKDDFYKLSLSGGGITIEEKEITENMARSIINLIMSSDNQTYQLVKEQPILKPEYGAYNELENIDQNESISPKKFMADKRPSSAVERVTCLAYYLSEYQNIDVFKTKDITQLNYTAAQPTLSNATVFTRNAVNVGYLAKAGGGSKQLSAFGKDLVDALPDRDKVQKVIEQYAHVYKKKSKKRKKKSKINTK